MVRCVIGSTSSAGLVLLLLLVSGISGCRSQPAVSTDEGGTGKSFQVKGIVVSSDAGKGVVTIDTEAVPGLMGAMIMPYKLAQPGVAGELHPGDHVTARLRVTDTASLLDQIDVTAQARPDYKPAAVYNVPARGQTVPNFKLLNQSGKMISIDQFHGKVLLVTFIYTRCPLPDYCIRMSRNFAEIQHQLSADATLYAKTHLLSVSFDPVHDTPEVLRAYGASYIGKDSAHVFAHWDFAAPPPGELKAIDEFFDVGASPGSNGTITHSLSTAVIAPDGKIFRWYPSNEWTPSGVVNDMKQAAAQ